MPSSSKVTRVCVLRSGGEYKPKHVQWLARQVPGLVCLSDVDVPGVPVVPMQHDFPGWWSKIELFSNAIPGDLLYFDLDTVVLGNIEALEAVGQTTMLSDFYRLNQPASGLMYIAQQDKQAVWNAWIKNPEAHMNRCRTTQHWGDQGFLRDVLPCKRWQDLMPGAIVSFKVHCKSGVPAGAQVVCFHGQPRPWASNQSWVPSC